MNLHIVKRLLAIVLGLLFVFSGLVKAIDPVGFSLKLTEYFDEYQLTQLTPFVIEISIIICAFETLSGFMLLMHIFEKLVVMFTTIFLFCLTIITFVTYVNPYCSITECGCFGEAINLSNGLTLGKNIFFLLLSLIYVCLLKKCHDSQICDRSLIISFLISLFISFYVPIYSYLFLPPFDFLPYNTGTHIQEKNKLMIYDSDLNNIGSKIISDSRPIYMISLYDNLPVGIDKKIENLYQAYNKGEIALFMVTPIGNTLNNQFSNIPTYYMDSIAMKSLLRASAGVICISEGRIIGKWNLMHTLYNFKGGYGKELTLELVKRYLFLGTVFFLMGVMFYMRNSTYKNNRRYRLL